MFPALLTHQKNSIQKEAAWMISNVTAGNVSQIQAVIDNGLIPLVVDIITKVMARWTQSASFLVAVVSELTYILILHVTQKMHSVIDVLLEVISIFRNETMQMWKFLAL